MGDSHLSRRSLFTAVTVLALGGRARAEVEPRAHVWPNGARAAVSLTYDDGLNSQLDNAVPELKRLGLKATFFLTADNAHWRLADWEALARGGNEVANHTMTHPCALAGYTAGRFETAEIDRMQGYLDRNFGPGRERTFAYPCGYLGLGHGGRHRRFARYRRVLERDGVVAARTTAGGPNRPEDVVADPLRLHAFEPTYEGDGVAAAMRYLNETVSRGGWAILVFHEVVPEWRGEGDASVASHNKILTRIAQPDLWCAPMGQVFDYVESRWRRRA
ncbi:MAG TPA: polysaccharide deacetylase family protein [Phenylobacterium sp.]|jgi:peptidoglycan/xylan/chitin deacetylase (PgdA/CDA1 family)|uniref:polysaccharide deacetylase family protein n=1 Tax=Phenylobacterium sp. TaxID=1871053 RepID=UPI002D4EE8F9|nr:polysaccharide deacetylase family protein [Phenylobacterium sp.]HZZ68890.1 polysaccharide deacetylase family protein [Phenylobacterium sp.]